MIFADYFFKKKIRKLIAAASAREHQFCPLAEAKNILVLYNVEDELVVVPFIDQLTTQGKQVNSVAYMLKADTRKQDSPDKTLSTSATFLVSGNKIPSKAICDRFNLFPADILIDLSREKSPPLKLLMLQHPAHFKVGIRYAEESIHDFAIIMTEGKSLSELSEQVLFYLQTIRSK